MVDRDNELFYERYRFHSSQFNSGVNEIYADQNGAWRRSETENGSEVAKVSNKDASSQASEASRADSLYTVLNSVSTTINGEIRRDDQAVYYLRSTDYHGEYFEHFQYVNSVDDLDLRAYVGEDGLIYEYRLSYTGSHEGREGPVTVDIHVKITDIQATTVSEPGWASQPQETLN